MNPSFPRLTSSNLRQILSTGYNGFPPGTENTSKNWEKGTKDDLVVHAEANAVLLTGQTDLEGLIAFVTMYPCKECAKMLIAVSVVGEKSIAIYSYLKWRWLVVDIYQAVKQPVKYLLLYTGS